MVQSQAYQCVGRVELFLFWTPGIQLVDVEIRIHKIPDGKSSELNGFITHQDEGICKPQNDNTPYDTTFNFLAPESEAENDHIESWRYQLSCRAHDVFVTVNEGGGTSTATAKAILN